MRLQTLPQTASRYAREQRQETADALAALRRLWRRMGGDFDASWSQIVPQVLMVLDVAQRSAANAATAYIPAVLAETGQRVRQPEYALNVDTLVGTAGDGRPTVTLVRGAVVQSKQAIASGATVPQALESGWKWLGLSAGTLLADTRRTSEKVAMGARHVGGYVRMLNPPSCGRCVILGGKYFRHNQGFQRHPRCDCAHIPASESIAGDWLVDSRAYLESLDEAGLRKALGSKANAQAFLDGADFNQIINAYRRSGDVATAQVYGSAIKRTQQGRNATWVATRRNGSTYIAGRDTGWSYRFRSPGFELGVDGRWMPETCYQFAADREHAIELLRQYGWIV